MTATRGDLFADHLETWIDVPVLEQGRIRSGVDCKGLVAGCAAELGFPEAASIHALAGDYGQIIPVSRLRAGLAELFDRATDLRRGDVLLLKVNNRAQHLGVYAPRYGTGGLRTIEALCRGIRKVRPYRRRPDEIASVWRWKDLR